MKSSFLRILMQPHSNVDSQFDCDVNLKGRDTEAGSKGDEDYGNWDKELWEGELIRYKCENTTLVIDNTKGLLKKEYQCQLNGEYDTPDNTGHLWPECTEQPVDPSKLDSVKWNSNLLPKYIDY